MDIRARAVDAIVPGKDGRDRPRPFLLPVLTLVTAVVDAVSYLSIPVSFGRTTSRTSYVRTVEGYLIRAADEVVFDQALQRLLVTRLPPSEPVVGSPEALLFKPLYLGLPWLLVIGAAYPRAPVRT